MYVLFGKNVYDRLLLETRGEFKLVIIGIRNAIPENGFDIFY